MNAKPSFNAFEKYFEKFIESIPTFVHTRFLPTIVFDVQATDGNRAWLLDFPNKQVRELKEPVDVEVIIQVHALVINDCSMRNMFSAWTPSKRLQIDLEGHKELSKLHNFLLLLDLFENDGLPLKKNFTLRNLGIFISRWREVVELLRMVVIYKILRRKLVVSALYRPRGAG